MRRAITNEKFYLLRSKVGDEDIQCFWSFGAKKIVESSPQLTQILVEKPKVLETKLTYEVEGQAYAVGEFRVRIGTIRVNNGPVKGRIVEIEYVPSESSTRSKESMKTFDQYLGIAHLRVHVDEAEKKDDDAAEDERETHSAKRLAAYRLIWALSHML